VNFSPLLAVAVRRRSVGLAIVRNGHLEYAKSQQLPSDHLRAVQAVAALLARTVMRFAPSILVVEDSLPKSMRRDSLYTEVLDYAQSTALPLWKVAISRLFEAFAVPAVSSRKQLRDVVQQMWPVVQGAAVHPLVWDAIALALFADTERVFTLSEQDQS